MTERPVSQVVKQSRYSHILFDERCRWTLFAQDFLQRRVQMFGKFAGHMHGPEGVLKTAVFSGGIDPTRTLQLIDITQALHPRRIDQSLFSDLAFGLRYGEL